MIELIIMIEVCALAAGTTWQTISKVLWSWNECVKMLRWIGHDHVPRVIDIVWVNNIVKINVVKIIIVVNDVVRIIIITDVLIVGIEKFLVIMVLKWQ